MKPQLETVSGQPSWRLAAGSVELFVSQTGGHVGPVTFQVRGRKIRPYMMAVTTIPKGFDRVATIAAAADGQSVTLISQGGKAVVTPLDLNLLAPQSGKPKTPS